MKKKVSTHHTAHARHVGSDGKHGPHFTVHEQEHKPRNDGPEDGHEGREGPGGGL